MRTRRIKEDVASDLYQSLFDSKWDCKYHVVFGPQEATRVLFVQGRRHPGEVFIRSFAPWTECPAGISEDRQFLLILRVADEVAR